jgi:hypothetical protein
LPLVSVPSQEKNFSQCALDWDFCQDFYRLQRRQTVHFLGIGKTGGSTIKHALKRHSVTREHVIRRHGHRKTVREIPSERKLFFSYEISCLVLLVGFIIGYGKGGRNIPLLYVGSMPDGQMIGIKFGLDVHPVGLSNARSGR